MKQRQIIKAAMERRGWDVAQLARETGIHRTLLRRYIDGAVSVGARNAPRLARALKVDIAVLLVAAA